MTIRRTQLREYLVRSSWEREVILCYWPHSRSPSPWQRVGRRGRRWVESQSEDALPAYIEAPGTIRAGRHTNDVARKIVAIRRARFCLNSVDLLHRLLFWTLLFPQNPPACFCIFLLPLRQFVTFSYVRQYRVLRTN